jgi:hypothetical protein
MSYQIKGDNNEWIDGTPTTDGQPYRFTDTAGGVVESFWSIESVDTRPVYGISNQYVTADGQQATLFAGNYYCDPGNVVQLVGTIVDDNGDAVTGINVPVAVKMPLVRHANGQPTTDEIYLNVTLINGVITATGKIERSGDWKILIDRNNEALRRIGADFKLSATDITFLA